MPRPASSCETRLAVWQMPVKLGKHCFADESRYQYRAKSLMPKTQSRTVEEHLRRVYGIADPLLVDFYSCRILRPARSLGRSRATAGQGVIAGGA